MPRRMDGRTGRSQEHRQGLFLHYCMDVWLMMMMCLYSKPALFDGLEVDQYVWAILQHLSTNPHAVEVTIDHTASWRTLDHGQFVSAHLISLLLST